MTLITVTERLLHARQVGGNTLARKSKPEEDQKLEDPKTYSCPHCGESFANESTGDQRSISHHRIMHVDDSSERWKLMDDWVRAK